MTEKETLRYIIRFIVSMCSIVAVATIVGLAFNNVNPNGLPLVRRPISETRAFVPAEKLIENQATESDNTSDPEQESSKKQSEIVDKKAVGVAEATQKELDSSAKNPSGETSKTNTSNTPVQAQKPKDSVAESDSKPDNPSSAVGRRSPKPPPVAREETAQNTQKEIEQKKQAQSTVKSKEKTDDVLKSKPAEALFTTLVDAKKLYDNNAIDTSYTYDNFNRITNVTDKTGSRTYSYDDNDNVTSVTTSYTGMSSSKTITYQYNDDGSRKNMNVDGVGDFGYSYFYSTDDNAFIIKTTAPWMTGVTHVQCLYDLRGKLTLQRTPRVNTTYRYNELGQMTSLTNQRTSGTSVPDSYYSSMRYDAAGNMLGYTYIIRGVNMTSSRQIDLSGTVSYTYDDKDQLINETRTCPNESSVAYNVSYSYDAAGNMTQIRGASANHNANNQITGYTYDANGNATSYRDNYSFAYDYEDLPTSLAGGSQSLTLAHRSDGLRAYKNGTYYLYDGDNVIAEYDQSGYINEAYLFSAMGLIQKRESASAFSTYMFDPLGSHVQTFYYVSASNMRINRNSVFDAFGKTILDKTNTGSNSNFPGRCGFVGQFGGYSDYETRPTTADTPLVLMGVRYYDPTTARFLTRDPIMGINDYTYCENNPVGYFDTNGKFVEIVLDVADVIWSAYDLIKEPSWKNGGYLVWSVVAVAVPILPGSWVVKTGKIVVNATDTTGDVTKYVIKTNKVKNASEIVAKSNYREVFFKHIEIPKEVEDTLQVHHRIPQKYRSLFGEEIVDRLSNLRAVDAKLHQQKITPEWNEFMRKNPDATKKQVEDFIKKIDKKYGDQFISP